MTHVHRDGTWYVTIDKLRRSSSSSIAQARDWVTVTPPALAMGSTNNYEPLPNSKVAGAPKSTEIHQRVLGRHTITGIDRNHWLMFSENMLVTFVNLGVTKHDVLVFANESIGSDARNRFSLDHGFERVLAAGQSLSFMYASGRQRWRPVGSDDRRIVALDRHDLERVEPPETDEEALQRHERLWQYHGAEVLRRTGKLPDVVPSPARIAIDTEAWATLLHLANQIDGGRHSLPVMPRDRMALTSAIKYLHREYARPGDVTPGEQKPDSPLTASFCECPHHGEDGGCADAAVALVERDGRHLSICDACTRDTDQLIWRRIP